MPGKIQILFIEDDPLDTELLVRALRRAGFDFDWNRVDTEPEFLAQLRPGLDLIFSDCSMPQFSGVRALELLKERGLEIPFIIISGSIGEESAVAAMKRLGAADCLPKDKPARLEEVVKHALKPKTQDS